MRSMQMFLCDLTGCIIILLSNVMMKCLPEKVVINAARNISI